MSRKSRRRPFVVTRPNPKESGVCTWCGEAMEPRRGTQDGRSYDRHVCPMCERLRRGWLSKCIAHGPQLALHVMRKEAKATADIKPKVKAEPKPKVDLATHVNVNGVLELPFSTVPESNGNRSELDEIESVRQKVRELAYGVAMVMDMLDM